jgi:uncharacterized membrane-anchored protein YhcB (DUF1043 family)
LKFKFEIKKNLEKIHKKLDEILRSLVKKFLQISDILLVKIQNESNMIKWAHLAHDAHGGYFLPPVSAEQKPRDSLLSPLEQATEADAVVQKSPPLEQNSIE